jgi:biotin carboxylase
MSKTVLVLGASRYQHPVIAHARAEGHRVVAVDARADSVGFEDATRAVVMDTTDAPAVLELARRERVDAAVVYATDVALPTLGVLVDALGIPGPGLAAARTLTRKGLFRAHQRERGLPAPAYHVVGPDQPLPPLDWAASPHWIVKPDQSSGSKGTRRVGSPDELREAVDDARGFSKSGLVIAEEYLPGHQLTCEGLLVDGALRFGLVFDRVTVPPPHVVTAGHTLPSQRPLPVRERALEAVVDALTGAGVRSTVFDADVVAHGDRVTLLEVTPRGGGNTLSRFIHASTGVDLVAHALSLALGQDPGEVSPTWAAPACGLMLFGATRRGRLSYDADALATLRARPWVHSVEVDAPPGAEVAPFINGRHRLGEAILFADSHDALERRRAELSAALALDAIPP